MKQKHSQYNFLKDPHLAYLIQSPYKIQQLLKTNRYKLQNNLLIQVDTNDSVAIDPYVLKRLNMEEIQKAAQRNSINYKLNELFQKQAVLNSKLQQLQIHKQNQYRRKKRERSPPQSKSQLPAKKDTHTISLPHIKGLKQFKMKIL